MNKTGLNFRSHACPRCGGDAFLDRTDEPEWRCLQCGRVVPSVADIRLAEAEPQGAVALTKQAA